MRLQLARSRFGAMVVKEEVTSLTGIAVISFQATLWLSVKYLIGALNRVTLNRYPYDSGSRVALSDSKCCVLYLE